MIYLGIRINRKHFTFLRSERYSKEPLSKTDVPSWLIQTCWTADEAMIAVDPAAAAGLMKSANRGSVVPKGERSWKNKEEKRKRRKIIEMYVEVA